MGFQMKTHIQFSGSSTNLVHWFLLFFFSHGAIGIGSSCSSSHLGLLLFSSCYYFFPFPFITLLPLSFFSLYCYYSSFHCYYSYLYSYYSFPIALILFLLVLLFSHAVALFLWWNDWIINYLIIKTDFN